MIVVSAALTAAQVAQANGAKKDSKADEVDTEHLFGFTEGTDVGEKGEKEAESEATGRFGKRDGAYAALSQQFEAKFTPLQNFRFGVAGSLAYYGISGVSGLDDRQQASFESLSLQMRRRLLDPKNAPFGLTVVAEPHWARVDDITGAPVDNYGGEFLVAVDKALVSNRIYTAFNLLYDPEATRSRVTGAWEHKSTFGASIALSGQIRTDIYLGVEARYLRTYSGLGFDSFAGHALFVGPNFYAKLSKKWWMSAAWNMQVAGHAAAEPGVLDLTNFERHQAKLRVGYNF